MTAFDPAVAAATYATMDTADLANIAFIDEGYLPEAKALAVRELQKRGALVDKGALLEDARRELAFRREAVLEMGDERQQQMERFKEKTIQAMLVAALWGFALIGPAVLDGDVASIGWTGVALFGLWLFYVVRALRGYEAGGRRTLVYIVIVPAVLFVIGSILGLGAS